MKQQIQNFGRGLLGILFPERCVFCGENTGPFQSVCSRCRDRVRIRPVRREIMGKDGNVFLCLAPFPYEGLVRDGLIAYKFRGREASFRFFGDVLAQVVKKEKEFQNLDWICNVPVSAKRKRERGFDQSEKVARQAAAAMGLPYERLLKKVRHNLPQHTLPGEQRSQNVENVYRACKPEKITGKTILLVDDIVTTGSTLRECGETLLKAGAAKVFLAAVASAGEEESQEIAVSGCIEKAGILY